MLVMDRILDPMLTLAGCSKHHRIVLAGSKAAELKLQLRRLGYDNAAATVDCGSAAGQFDFAFVDWRGRSFKQLAVALGWVPEFLSPRGVLLVWIDPQRPAASQNLRLLLARYGFTIEDGTVHECGFAVTARRCRAEAIGSAALRSSALAAPFSSSRKYRGVSIDPARRANERVRRRRSAVRGSSAD
jgi:hypothetical protein